MVMPCLRTSQPTPPPRVRPPIPVLGTIRRDSETEGVGLAIEIAKRGAALDADGALRGIDMDGAHPRQVDDDAIVAKGTAADVVTSASDGGEQAVSRAKSTAAMMSASPEQRAMSAGRLFTLAFHRRHAAS